LGYVTEEVRRLIGSRGPKQTAHAPIGADELRRFVHAVMETDPVHWDKAVARERGYGGVVATPLYPVHALRRPDGSPDPFERFREQPDWDGTEVTSLGGLCLPDIPLKRILNGGVEAEFFQLARVGDVISSQAHIVDIVDRAGKSGPMVMVTLETVFINQDQAVLARIRNTFIMR
jgi:acyl dehydratase